MRFLWGLLLLLIPGFALIALAQTNEQITQTPLQSTPPAATDNILIQPGGIGTPYVHTTWGAFVTSLFNGNMPQIPLNAANNLSDLGNKTTALTNLGVTSIVQQPAANPNFQQVSINTKAHATALTGTTSSTAAANLTIDGLAPSATNCINLTAGQSARLDIKVSAYDQTNVANWYLWSTTQNYLAQGSAGVSATTFQLGLETDTLASATNPEVTIILGANTTHGCLTAQFMPPAANTDQWVINAMVNYVVAP